MSRIKLADKRFIRHGLCWMAIIVAIFWPLTFSAQAEHEAKLDAEQVYEQSSKNAFYLRVYHKDGSLKTVGTGVLISNGTALTASHVVTGGERYEAIFEKTSSVGQNTFVAKVVQNNHASDLAILQLEGIPNTWTFQDLSQVNPKYGEKVYAIGYPLKDTKVITEGIVNAPIVTLNGKVRLLSSATVAPGMSGGPLLNDKGDLVGLISGSTKTMNEMHVIIPLNIIQKMIGGQ